MSSSVVGEAGTWPDAVEYGERMRDKDWSERADHPLMNDLILKLLFEHVSVRRSDLKACRGVCKKWNQHTIDHMRSNFQVTINGNEYGREANAKPDRMVDFVELLKSNELGIPFEKYRLGPFLAAGGVGKQFLEICGESIKEIDLFESKICARRVESVSELLKFSPKLEALTLCGHYVSLIAHGKKLFPDSTPVLSSLKKLTVNLEYSKSPVRYWPTFFKELLSVASNISHIAIEDIGYDKYDTKPESTITHVLNVIEKLGMESSIQSLSLKSATVNHVEILQRMAEKPYGLKLKEINFKSNISWGFFIHIMGNNRHPPVQVQHALAKIFKDTLEEFNVIDESPGINLMEFPKMAKLKTFKFSAMKDFGNKPVNLNYVFPLIEILSIEFRQFRDFRIVNGVVIEPVELFSQFQVCPTIQTLIVENSRRSVRSFHNISRVFPNLKKLTLSIRGGGEIVRLAGQVLLQIWTGMTQLESLSLLLYIDAREVLELDSIVTGISIEGLNYIRNIIPGLERMAVRERSEKILALLEKYRTQQPSIRNLRNLRHLKLGLCTRAGWQNRNLSDLSGYFGIYLMKRLNHLDIQHCQFTKTCCDILTKETGVEAWSFQTGEFGNIDMDIESQYIIPPFPTPCRDEDDYN